MQVSQKSMYALRAVLELAKRYGQGPVAVAEIARIQSIPRRFLEVILRELKQGGFVSSRRGSEGGYELSHWPEELTVGEIMEFIQGPVGPTACLQDRSQSNNCRFRTQSHCIFRGMWQRVHEAVSSIYNGTTFGDLVQQEKRQLESFAAG